MLHLLARADGPVVATTLAAQSGLAPGAVQDALTALARRDLVTPTDDGWDLLMPLFRRWLRLQANT